jgi:hypothetical protein
VRSLFVSLLLLSPSAFASELRYDVDYPVVAYSAKPVANEIARLQAQIDRGELKLEFTRPRGYLDSLLRALRIDPSSQVLVYSKTSLQFQLIRAATPRAIYFNDDTYVAWVQGSNILEIATMDGDRGAVFYTLLNHHDTAPKVARETSRCLSCHDTFSMTGGGVPRFLFLSAPVDSDGVLQRHKVSIETDDRTPFSERWGGWYSTNAAETLDARFDTRPYLTNRSDAVALLVLQHQLYIKNLITRLSFKTRTFLAREKQERWEDATPATKRALQRMMDGLVEAMLFCGAAPLDGSIRGGAAFEQSFGNAGPRAPDGRSLREFDLQTRLFKYPLSYVIYSEAFDALPANTRTYLYGRLDAVLAGEDRSPTFAHLTDADRAAIRQILTATKPEFARTLN